MLATIPSVTLMFLEMTSSFKNDEMFLLDPWPLAEPTLILFDPEAAAQVCQKLNLPKGRVNETMIFHQLVQWPDCELLDRIRTPAAVRNAQTRTPMSRNYQEEACEVVHGSCDRRIPQQQRGRNTSATGPGFPQNSYLRLFLFAGNDTTSCTIVFAYHLLSKHPDVFAQLRDEHDRVFGLDPSSTADQIKDGSSLLNQCRLTQAVIK
ncbi:hypothetical protein BDV95DRAFT_592361 [Massariosphaeria phaeospora]|uniref:Cytochrome P450 n=1 Tax=Massariosphaeria phaeospora TaxID=100035 RepID=A0A7C8MDW5_9PLEO|nr:hypothetical protein BDV95DRAFT_592361 [Massariosphaeria phaeospora]